MGLSKKIFIVTFLYIFCNQSFGQILDDSTKMVYSAKTTHFVTEDDIKYNRNIYYENDTLRESFWNIDTLFEDYNRMSFIRSLNNEWLDLGNLGTPMKPIYYTAPRDIGRVSGFNSLDNYFYGPSRIRYYDTKSPYSKLFLNFGGENRSVVDINYSRNIKLNWNIGGDFHSINADKQYRPQQRGDRNVSSTGFDIYTRFRSLNYKYQLLANYSRLKHKINDQGGIIPPDRMANGRINSNGFDSVMFLYEDAPIWLSDARSTETRNSFHLFQQYRLNDIIQPYLSLDHYTQKNSFFVPVVFTNSRDVQVQFFPNIDRLNDTVKTPDSTYFRNLMGEAGIKGDLLNMFYSFYFKQKHLLYRNIYNGSVENFAPKNQKEDIENYLGFNLRYDLNQEQNIEASGEYLLFSNYYFNFIFNTKILTASYSRHKYSPSYLSESYHSNFIQPYSFDNLIPVSADVIKGSINLDFKQIKITPFASFSSVYNPIYRQTFYDTVHSALPEQTRGESLQEFTVGGRASIVVFKNLYFDLFGKFAQITGSSSQVKQAFNVPAFLGNASVYHQKYWFNEKLLARIGFDIHFRSPYNAHAYDPVTQQFMSQGFYKTEPYPIVDVFANLKIRSAKIFVKLTHANQGIPQNGYVLLPYYTWQKRVLDLGISWMFFD